MIIRPTDIGSQTVTTRDAQAVPHAYALDSNELRAGLTGAFVLVEGLDAQTQETVEPVLRTQGMRHARGQEEQSALAVISELSQGCGTGSSVVCALSTTQKVVVAWRGDVAIYLYHAHVPISLHTAPARRQADDFWVVSHELGPTDQLVLISSGVSRAVSQQEISRTIDSLPEADLAAEWLATAGANGGEQEASAIVVRFSPHRTLMPASRSAVRPLLALPVIALAGAFTVHTVAMSHSQTNAQTLTQGAGGAKQASRAVPSVITRFCWKSGVHAQEYALNVSAGPTHVQQTRHVPTSRAGQVMCADIEMAPRQTFTWRVGGMRAGGQMHWRKVHTGTAGTHTTIVRAFSVKGKKSGASS